jgi:hypothetical protein
MFSWEQAYSLESSTITRKGPQLRHRPHPSDAAPDGDASAGETVYPVFGPDGACCPPNRAEGRTASSPSSGREYCGRVAYDEEGLLSGRVSNRFGGQLLVSVETFSEDGTTAAYADTATMPTACRPVSADEYEAEAFYDSSAASPPRRPPSVRKGTERTQVSVDERDAVREFASTPKEKKRRSPTRIPSIPGAIGSCANLRFLPNGTVFGLRRGARVVRKLTY